MMAVYVEGAWRRCPVRAREDRADGTIAYHVDVELERDGAACIYQRAYWWDPRTLRPLHS